MTETKHAFRVLDDVGTPDLWERIESREHHGETILSPLDRCGSEWRRWPSRQ